MTGQTTAFHVLGWRVPDSAFPVCVPSLRQSSMHCATLKLLAYSIADPGNRKVTVARREGTDVGDKHVCDFHCLPCQTLSGIETKKSQAQNIRKNPQNKRHTLPSLACLSPSLSMYPSTISQPIIFIDAPGRMRARPPRSTP